MIVWLPWLLQVVAVVVAGWAAAGTYFAVWFRIEGSSELQMIKNDDLQLGGAFALAVVLFFVPDQLKKPVRCLLIVGIAAWVWVAVSGGLIFWHDWQVRV